MQLTIPCARRRHFYNLRHSGYLTPLVSGSGKTKNCGRKWREFVVHVAVVGASSRLVQQHAKFCGYWRYIRLSVFIVLAQKFYLYLGSTLSGHLSSFMVKCARRSDGRGLNYLFACVFLYIYFFLFLFFLFKKKRGPEGRVHVLSTPGWVNYMIVWVSAL